MREFPIGEGASVLGRDDSCDIRVDDRKVSRRHAAFRLIDGQPWAEDLGSVNGIKLNGKKVNQRALMLDGDVVQVGGYEVRLKAVSKPPRTQQKQSVVGGATPDTMGMRAWPPDTAQKNEPARLVVVGQTKPVAGRRFPLSFGESIVGRLDECAVPILDGSVSRQHASIVLTPDSAVVTDLGSSNGTFVNDTRIDKAELTHGDRLKFGSVDFRVELSSEIPSRVGPLEPSRMAPAGTRSERGARKTGVIAAAVGMVVLAAAAIALVGHRTGRWAVPGLPVPRSAPPIDDPLAGEPLASATPSASPGAGPEAPDPTPAAVASAPPSASPDATPAPSATASPDPTPDPSVEPTPAPARDPRPDATADPTPAPSPTAVATRPTAPTAPRTVRTATSPYGPRDAEGMPTALPEVDPTFDFEGFVAAYLQRAQELEAAGQFAEMRAVIAELLTRDPINSEAKALRRRADVAEKAAKVLAEGDALRAEGKLMRALELYAAVPADTPQGQQAKARITELEPAAVRRELERVDIELKRDKTWPSAQRRLCEILSVDRDNADARRLLEELEPDMRAKGMTPVACDEEPPATATAPGTDAGTAPDPSPGPTAPPVSKSEEIGKMWPDRTLQRIVQSYAEGDLTGAVKRADLAAKKIKGRSTARALHASLVKLQKKYERVRNEVGNDPSVAWAQLLELQKLEAEVLPTTVKSFLASDLEHTIADAFAERGAAAYEQERYDVAFTQWDSGLKLNPQSPKIQQGLAKLEQLAEKWTKEAELAAQRGQPDACDRWRQITRMTRGAHPSHKTARARLQQGC